MLSELRYGISWLAALGESINQQSAKPKQIKHAPVSMRLHRVDQPPIDSSNVSISRRPMFAFIIEFLLLKAFGCFSSCELKGGIVKLISRPWENLYCKEKIFKIKLHGFTLSVVSLCVSLLMTGQSEIQGLSLQLELVLLAFCWCDF